LKNVLCVQQRPFTFNSKVKDYKMCAFTVQFLLLCDYVTTKSVLSCF